MSIKIEDGHGKGIQAGVGRRGRLFTRSISHSGEFESSLEGRSFIVGTKTQANTVAINSAVRHMITLENTSDTRDLVISNVFACSDTAGTVVVFDRNPTYKSGALDNVTSAAAVNMNFKSGILAECTANIFNASAGTTGISGITVGSKLNTFILREGTTNIPVDEGFILGNGDRFGVQAGATTSGVRVSFSIRFHYADVADLDEFV